MDGFSCGLLGVELSFLLAFGIAQDKQVVRELVYNAVAPFGRLQFSPDVFPYLPVQRDQFGIDHVEQFKTSNGEALLGSQVQALVQAMAASRHRLRGRRR